MKSKEHGAIDFSVVCFNSRKNAPSENRKGKRGEMGTRN